jgi:hypothetical protein
MSESRNKAIGLLDLPIEIPTAALPRVIESYDDQTKVMAALSSTCKPLYGFFQPELDQRAAQQLLSLVLKPTKANLEKAKKMYTVNPRLLFIESMGEEYAAGLDENLKNIHRIVKASPIQAMAGAGDRWLLKEVIETDEFKKYVNPASKKTANELATAEIKKQFPNGFDFPPSTYDFGPLIDAITNDQSLIQHNVPSAATEELLAQFRKDFLPDAVVTSGHFFNLNELVRAFELYDANWQPWNGNQLSLFWRQVIGYFEGLVSGVTGEVISQGIMNVIDGKPPHRQYDFKNYVTDKKESYFPLTADPTSRLGLTFGVDSDTAGGGMGAAWLAAAVTKLMSSNNNELGRIYATLAATTNPTCGCKP